MDCEWGIEFETKIQSNTYIEIFLFQPVIREGQPSVTGESMQNTLLEPIHRLGALIV